MTATAQQMQAPRRSVTAFATLWSATSPAEPAVSPLATEIEADVLVIGGGIAGMTTALHLAEAGIDTVLVEAAQLGDGATGKSGGLVAPDYIRHSPETIGPVLGRSAAERMTRLIGSSAEGVFNLIERHSIECEARQDGFYTPAHHEALATSQQHLAEQWRSRGHPVEFIASNEARKIFGAGRYCGALRFAQGGSLNPLAYVRGLGRAAIRQGARVFVRTSVQSLAREGGRWIARSAAGAVSARRVVLAANGGNARLHPALQRTTLPLQVAQFATAPMSAEECAHVLPGGGAFTDKAPYLFTARRDPAGHLISAFPVTHLVRGRGAYLKEAKRRLRQHFPALPDPRIAYLWEGRAWINVSFLPEIYELGDNALAIQADNGRGISVNTMVGMELARMLATGDPAALSVRPRPPMPIRMHKGAALLPKLMMSMAYLSN